MPRLDRPCPVCARVYDTVTDALACWIGHDPAVLRRPRAALAAPLACTLPRITQALQELGYRPRRTP